MIPVNVEKPKDVPFQEKNIKDKNTWMTSAVIKHLSINIIFLYEP